MLAIQIIIITSALVGIVFLYFIKNKEKNQRSFLQNEHLQAKKKLSFAKDDFTNIENTIFKLIDEKFGAEYSENIKNGIVTVGMPSTFLTMAWGYPQRVERNEENEGEQWFYKGQNAVNATQTKVIIENERVIKLKDF